MLADGRVKAAVEKARAERSECAWLTREYVLEGLKRETERSGPGSSPTKALQRLGQHLALFVERHPHGGDPKNPTPMKYEPEVKELSDQERRKRIEAILGIALARRAGGGPASS